MKHLDAHSQNRRKWAHQTCRIDIHKLIYLYYLFSIYCLHLIWIRTNFRNRKPLDLDVTNSRSINDETRSLQDCSTESPQIKRHNSEKKIPTQGLNVLEQLSNDQIEIKSEGESIEENNTSFNSQELLNTPEDQSLGLQPEFLEIKKPPTVLSELCQKDVLLKFLRCIFLQIGIYSIYGPSLYLNNDLGIPNIYLNGSLLALIGMCGYTLNFFFASKMGHRSMNIMINLIVLFCCLSLLIMDLISNAYVPYDQRCGAIKIIETGSLSSPLGSDLNIFL